VVSAVAAPHHATVAVARATPRSSPTTVVTEAPVKIAAAPVRQVVATTTTVPIPVPTTTTTTTTEPSTTTTAPAAAPAVVLAGESDPSQGDVTYYDHPAGRCASPRLPFGTVVTITNPANGATVTCVVDDREADTARSIDLATATFAELAPLSQGVIYANLRW
jgi:hypothetical protein